MHQKQIFSKYKQNVKLEHGQKLNKYQVEMINT